MRCGEQKEGGIGDTSSLSGLKKCMRLVPFSEKERLQEVSEGGREGGYDSDCKS